MVTSREKSVFLCREQDAWVAKQYEKAALEAAEGELVKECEVSTDLRQRCSKLKAEARDAREKVAPLLKRVSDLVQESQQRNAAAERYKGEVIRVETLLTQRDLALTQAQDELAEARRHVSQWQGQAKESKKRVEGNSRNLTLVVSV